MKSGVDIDALIGDYFSDLPRPDREIAKEIVTTAVELGREQVSRLDRKIVNSALKELRRAFLVFAPYKGVRKVSIFGSARATKGDPEYAAARDFSAAIAEKSWMVITGAGPGIMEAGHEGAGGELSFGANILLPFEYKPNPVIANDAKLVNFKYFFTRKLTFMKEADAFVLLPGGFGTLDETFELLTLVQTGKSTLKPIVLLDAPGGRYWRDFDDYIGKQLEGRGYVTHDDRKLYRLTDDVREAVDEIETFYRVYHSQRVVGKRLIFRLNVAPEAAVLQELSTEFADILSAPIEAVDASDVEIKDQDVPDLARISLAFDRRQIGRLRQLVDRLNEIGPPASPTAAKGDPHEL